MDQTLMIIIISLGAFLLGYLFAKTYFLTNLKRHRSQAIAKSKSVHKGFNNEKLAPFLPGFNYSPRDMTFIGKGIDYIVFKGLAQGFVEEIILLEIKTGSSQQNKNEKLIAQAVKSGNVRYEIYRR